jgi:hypothetical protein
MRYPLTVIHLLLAATPFLGHGKHGGGSEGVDVGRLLLFAGREGGAILLHLAEKQLQIRSEQRTQKMRNHHLTVCTAAEHLLTYLFSSF